MRTVRLCKRRRDLSVPLARHNEDLAGLLTTRTLQIVPSIAKYLVVLLFLVQIRSWPFTWHCESLHPFLSSATTYLGPGRVWSPVFALRGRFLLHKCSNLLRSPATRKVKNLEWLEEFSPIGANPFEKQFTYKMWAGECMPSVVCGGPAIKVEVDELLDHDIPRPSALPFPFYCLVRPRISSRASW